MGDNAVGVLVGLLAISIIIAIECWTYISSAKLAQKWLDDQGEENDR
jgi:hypothetical protein